MMPDPDYQMNARAASSIDEWLDPIQRRRQVARA